MGSRKLFGFLFFSWITLLTVLSLIPADNLDMDGPDIPYLDKWIHLGFYMIAMVLGVLFLWERFRPQVIKRSSFYWLGTGLAVYGMIIEVLQGVGGQQRSAEWRDLAANIVGIGLGASISLLILRKAGGLN